MFNGAYTFGTGFLWKLSINSFPALVCCHIHVHSTFCEWDNITLDFSNLSANLVKQRNLTFFPFNPTTTNFNIGVGLLLTILTYPFIFHLADFFESAGTFFSFYWLVLDFAPFRNIDAKLTIM